MQRLHHGQDQSQIEKLKPDDERDGMLRRRSSAENIAAPKLCDGKSLTLIPTTPAAIQRYEREVGGGPSPSYEVVAANTHLHLTSALVGTPWKTYTTPEGDNYFLNGRIVTSTNVNVRASAETIIRAYLHLLDLGRPQNPQIGNHEVYIHISLETPTACCVEYYFIDHEAQHPFWVQAVRVQDLGLPRFQSPEHLKSSLAPEYWVHIEYYPVHQVLDPSLEAELISMFRHGCTDDMTSFGSTFPYSARECREHLITLTGFHTSGEEQSAYKTATFARLWASVARVRHINRYALPGPRLDRSQGLEEFKRGQQPTVALRVIDALFLSLPRSKFDRITELWNGRVVFQRHWHIYFDEQRGEWKRMGVLGAVIFLSAVVLISTDGPKPLALASASLASTSVISSLYLHESHSKFSFSTASDISAWIMRVESFHSGLIPLAIKFTVPQATTIHSGFFLLASIVELALVKSGNVQGTILALGAMGPVALILLAAAFF